MKQLRRLVIGTFCDWLRDRLPSAGKPYVHDFRARVLHLVEMMPDEPRPESLDLATTRACLEWAFHNMIKSAVRPNEDDDGLWVPGPLAIHVLRLVAIASAADVLAAITRQGAPPASLPNMPTLGGGQ